MAEAVYYMLTQSPYHVHHVGRGHVVSINFVCLVPGTGSANADQQDPETISARIVMYTTRLVTWNIKVSTEL